MSDEMKEIKPEGPSDKEMVDFLLDYIFINKQEAAFSDDGRDALIKLKNGMYVSITMYKGKEDN